MIKMLSFIYAECHFFVMLSVFLLSVIMLKIAKLSVMLSVFVLSVIMPIVIAPLHKIAFLPSFQGGKFFRFDANGQKD
jgi:hypothetical protein